MAGKEDKIAREAREWLEEEREEVMERNKDVLELLAEERVEKREKERRKLVEDLNKEFDKIRKILFDNPNHVEVLEGLED